MLCMASLHERYGTPENGEGEQDNGADEKRAQAAVRAPLSLGFALAPLPARGQKLPLELVQLGIVGRRPVAGHGQTRPPQERARVASERLPLLSSFGQPPVQKLALPVGVEPGAERRPRANERLVRKFNRVLTHGDEARIGERE